jgi:hypothetical protein
MAKHTVCDTDMVKNSNTCLCPWGCRQQQQYDQNPSRSGDSKSMRPVIEEFGFLFDPYLLFFIDAAF